MLQKDLPKLLGWTLLAALLVYITGWFVNLLEWDSARYAALAMEISKSGDYFSNTKYFVKPAILLWPAAFSMSVFGPNHIAYRITRLLPAIIALYSVYRFSRLHYSREVGLLAALILATTMAAFLINNELGPANYQAALLIFVIWQREEYQRRKNALNFVLCSVSAAFFLFAKGTSEYTGNHFAPFNLSVTLLWSFAPWTMFLFLGLWERLKNVLHLKSAVGRTETITFYGFLLILLILSLNPYQFAFDGFIVYPLGAVIAADYILKTFYSGDTKTAKTIYILQISLSYVAIAAMFCLVWFPFPETNYYGLIHFMALLSAFTWLVFFSGIRNKLIISCIILAIGFNLILNSYFYPNLSAYQAGPRLGALAKVDGVLENRLFTYQAEQSHLLHFYSGVQPQQNNDFANLAAAKNCWIYTRESFLEEFRSKRPDLKVVGRSPDLSSSAGILDFLNPETRDKTIVKMVLIRL